MVKNNSIKVGSESPSFSDMKPELLSEWNSKKNNSLNIFPEKIYYSSNTSVWWICQEGHEWENTLAYRSRGFGKCKVCKGLQFKEPEIWSEIHPTLNTDLFEKGELSKTTLATSPLKIWWLGDCGHSWDMPIRARVKSKQNCPYCSNQRVLVGFNDIATTKPELLEYWDIRNKIKPTEITYGSKKTKIIWTNVCGHTWATTPNHRIKVKNDYCPKCISVIETYPEIENIFNQELNPDIDLSKISVYSKKIMKWKIDCGHIIERTMFGRLNSLNDCYYCSRFKVLPGFNDLVTTHENLVEEWDYEKNPKLPSEYLSGSQEKVWWICKKSKHSTESIISDRSRGFRCSKCSYKRSKGEIEVYDFIESLGYKAEASRRDLLEGKKEIDIYISDLKVGVEYNGEYWHSLNRFNKNKEMSPEEIHNQKLELAKNSNIILLYIWESDWIEEKKKIKKLLKETLYNIERNGKAQIPGVFSKISSSKY